MLRIQHQKKEKENYKNIEEIEVDNISDLQESETRTIENLKVKEAVLPTEINQQEENFP